MSFFDKIKELINRILRREDKKSIPLLNETNPREVKEENVTIENSTLDLPENELVSFDKDGILDAESEESVAKLKHNINVLVKSTKESGKIDKFMSIREDDFFPFGWKWNVLSKNTNYEKQKTYLTYALRKAYALRESGLEEYTTVNDMKVPLLSENQIFDAMNKVDKSIGDILLPARFRSTKHFTVNTPLEGTGDTNQVTQDRDFIILDNAEEILKSGYGYSVSYHDLYADVTHEGIPISENAIVLIKDENYERIMSDPKIAEELSKRKAIRFKGDTYSAILMVLTENGVLPAKIAAKYANYDNETQEIINSSFRNLAKENGLLYDRSHGGDSSYGHFSNYFDEKNEDYENAVKESVEFLADKFPEHKDIILKSLYNHNLADDIVKTVGIDEMMKAIDEYNKLTEIKAKNDREAYLKERQTIDEKTHIQFTEMVSVLNKFYDEVPFDSDYEGKKEIEESAIMFFHGNTVKDQKEGLKKLWEHLRPRIEELQNKKEEKNILIENNLEYNNNNKNNIKSVEDR